MPRPAQPVCEILAPDPATRRALAATVRFCARSLGQALRLQARVARTPVAGGLLTLRLPIALAASQDRVWCLACRLTCFCPGARVSVLVTGESAFREPAAPRRLRSA
jgi:hypothetical protein